jgi:hypothetical protein
MAAPIRLAPEVVIGAPLKLFEIAADFTGELDVAHDSKKFVMIGRGQKLVANRYGGCSCKTNWLISREPGELAVKATNVNGSVES